MVERVSKPAKTPAAAEAATTAAAKAAPLAAPGAAGSSTPAILAGADTLTGAGALDVDERFPGKTQAEIETALDGSIKSAIAGARPIPTPAPTPALEAAKAIEEAEIDPRPGSGTLDDHARLHSADRAYLDVLAPAYSPLTLDEIAALDAELALLPPEVIAEFRTRLASRPIDPVKGQGSLDDRTWVRGGVTSTQPFHDALWALGERRTVAVLPAGSRLELIDDARSAIDGPALRVISAVEGFRRAGRAWSKAPTYVALDALTPDQLDALEADPNLVTERV